MEFPNDIKDLKLLVSVLLKRIDDLENEIVTLRSENVNLWEENSALQSRLKLNSKNSHKPPSFNSLSKKPGLPKAAAKKTGSERAHTGTSFRMVEQPDELVVHHAVSCPCCKKKFSGADVASIIQKRQVFDIPKPRMEVTYYQLGMITCYSQTLYGTFPEKVNQPVQSGSRIKLFSVFLNNEYKLPLKKIEQLMRDLWCCCFNESTIVNTNAGMYASLQVVEQEIRENIFAIKRAHFDETNMRVSKKLHWFHAASTEMFNHLFVYSHRGKAALESEVSSLKDYTPRAVQDYWVTYFNFPNCTHALCSAHLLRDITNLAESGSEWASKIHYVNEQTRHGIIDDPERETWPQEFEQISLLADRRETQLIWKGRENPKKN